MFSGRQNYSIRYQFWLNIIKELILIRTLNLWNSLHKYLLRIIYFLQPYSLVFSWNQNLVVCSKKTCCAYYIYACCPSYLHIPYPTVSLVPNGISIWWHCHESVHSRFKMNPTPMVWTGYQENYLTSIPFEV